MQEAGWMPCDAAVLDDDLTSALETHEAVVAGLARFLEAVREMALEASRARIDQRQPRCA